jgi:thiaminase
MTRPSHPPLHGYPKLYENIAAHHNSNKKEFIFEYVKLFAESECTQSVSELRNINPNDSRELMPHKTGLIQKVKDTKVRSEQALLHML